MGESRVIISDVMLRDGIQNIPEFIPTDEKIELFRLIAASGIRDIEIMAPVASDLCSSYIIAGECSKTADLAPRVLDLIEKANRELESFGRGYNVHSVLCAYYGHSLGWLGDFVEGERFCEKGLHLALVRPDG